MNKKNIILYSSVSFLIFAFAFWGVLISYFFGFPNIDGLVGTVLLLLPWALNAAIRKKLKAIPPAKVYLVSLVVISIFVSFRHFWEFLLNFLLNFRFGLDATNVLTVGRVTGDMSTYLEGFAILTFFNITAQIIIFSLMPLCVLYALRDGTSVLVAIKRGLSQARKHPSYTALGALLGFAGYKCMHQIEFLFGGHVWLVCSVLALFTYMRIASEQEKTNKLS